MSRGPTEPSNPHERPRLRGGTLIALSVLAAGLVGLFIGTQGTSSSSRMRKETLQAAVAGARTEGAREASAASDAVRWKELPTAKRGPNAGFVNALGKLVQPQLPAENYENRDIRLGEALSSRAANRAFDGAPPTVPHTMDERHSHACLACHGEGLVVPTQVGSGVVPRVAPKMSHELYMQCSQCHVASERTTVVFADSPPLDSAFVAMRTAPGDRFFPDAPPTTPHGTFMRGDCVSCHGPLGDAGLRTTHPERANCLQCHATNHPLEQNLGAR